MGGAVGTHLGAGIKFDHPRHKRANHAGFCRTHPTGVEGTHGELGARFTDGLGGDNANCLSQVNQFVVSKGPAIAFAAYGTGRFTGER